MSGDYRAISVTELITKRYNQMEFTGAWKRSLGCPELAGTWIIYGKPKNGKTAFALMLCKYLTRFAKVAYDSLEEGTSVTLRDAFLRVGMLEVKGRIVLLNKEPIPQLILRLRRQKSPQIIVIDSLQYTGMNYNEYKALKDEFPHKLFIFISHAEGKEPAGRVARAVRYDANITIMVEAFKAFASGRYGGGEPFVIWPDEAIKYWGN